MNRREIPAHPNPLPPGEGVGKRRIAAGDLEAVFLLGRGMLGASLKHRGVELLRRIEDLDAAAARGSTAGIPLLHPWANRLGGLRYRAAGREVELDPSSPLLHLDDQGLPIHGVPWSRLAWEVVSDGPDRLAARLEWVRADLIAIFPYPHCLEMAATLSPSALTLETTLVAGPEGPVPLALGFHPYLGLSGIARADWRVELPAMRRLLLDAHGIPDGREEPCPALDVPLGGRAFDDGFALDADGAALAVSGGGRRISVELVEGYRFTQVYAPAGKDLIAFEPMTAPTNSLQSGRALRLVAPGERARAVFRVRVDP
jgi:aldose 1-epimerase